MIKKVVHCNTCGAEINVDSYREFVVCPYCDNQFEFEGFDYREIDWNSSMYSSVKKWIDCPVCRSKNMFFGPSGKKWKCPDCGYVLTDKELKKGVLWFCDNCETFLNTQKGFSATKGKWKCAACGYDNDVSKKSII